MKWNMGWMHDMLNYFSEDPVYRKYHHNNITFSMLYAFTENFVLPISHDEVVHGKRSLLNKMPGDEWQKFANVRAFLAYMYAHPGKKLLFMGTEIGEREEWNHDASAAVGIAAVPIPPQAAVLGAGAESFLPRATRRSIRWISTTPASSGSISAMSSTPCISFLRRAEDPADFIVFACNFTPVPREHYAIGVPEEGFYREILNTDSRMFGGSNMGNGGRVASRPVPSSHGRPLQHPITLPPLAVVASE